MRLFRSMALLTAVTLVGAGTALGQATEANRPPVSRTPHPTEGKTDCLSCHAAASGVSFKTAPATHSYPNEACLNCHRLADRMPPHSRHAMDSMHSRCTGCHVEDGPTDAKIPPAASHANRRPATCTMCHQQEPPPPR